MANYSIEQALKLSSISAELKEYLLNLKGSRLPNVRNKVFTASNQETLRTLLNAEMTKSKEAKAKRTTKQDARNQCFAIIKSLIGGKTADGKSQQIISPVELLPKLQAFKSSIEAEKNFGKIDKLLSSSGMTKEQLIEYLQR